VGVTELYLDDDDLAILAKVAQGLTALRRNLEE
jgi:hypothetical protein